MPGAADTPMFRQYRALKAQVPDALLLFRMGDFYELFFDDARVAAEELDLTLTSRNRGQPDEIPMAGVPHQAARGYVRTLIERGYKVAIADQVEDPRRAKGLVERAITRVITPGMVLEPEDLSPAEPCWLGALVRVGRRYGVALLDASTGAFRVAEVAELEAGVEELARAGAREVLLPEALRDPPATAALGEVARTAADEHLRTPAEARTFLLERYGVATLAGFGLEDAPAALVAAAAALAYAEGAARGRLPQLRPPRRYAVGEHMVLDATTRRNLEIFRPLHGEGSRGTLLALLDGCATAMGSRLLRSWLAWPLMDRRRIARRQDALESLVEAGRDRRRLRGALREVADLERLAGKVARGTAHARDLSALRGSLRALPAVLEVARALPALAPFAPQEACADLADRIDRVLVDDPPLALTEGGMVRSGVVPELDELRELARGGRNLIAALEAREREATGIGSLKVRHNRVYGYFIEVTRANLHRVPEHYVRRQTLSTCERFVTPELKELEERVLGADERRKALELEIFERLREGLRGEVARLQRVAGGVARLDVLAALAEVAADRRYVRPALTEEPVLEIEGGRHPVVEVEAVEEAFVPNDLRLGGPGRRLLVLTGPNMAGKSTVMRQAALIALLAQVGSFVPADAARVGICDRIFTRVGATDDLASGRSTFMVEMSETANIVHHATDRSLVILDEIGRGTSTSDGLAIAWAVAEHLHDRTRCRALFATHYHELVQLADTRPDVANISLAVSEFGDRIIFLRRLKEGGASRSYGVQCARLAGMPETILRRARELLVHLERHARSHPGPQLALFDLPPLAAESAPVEPEPPPPDPLRERLAALDPDDLRPREALAILYELHELARGEPAGSRADA